MEVVEVSSTGPINFQEASVAPEEAGDVCPAAVQAAGVPEVAFLTLLVIFCRLVGLIEGLALGANTSPKTWTPAV